MGTEVPCPSDSEQTRTISEAKERRWFDLYCCLSLPELTPRHLEHCTQASTSPQKPPGLKNNHFLQPSPRKSHIGRFFSRGMFNARNWALICFRASSSHCVQRHSVRSESDWLFPVVWENLGYFVFAQVWAQEPYSPSHVRGSPRSSSQ